MPERKRPQIFRVKRYLPANRVQQQRIKIPQPPYRPLRMDRRDVVQRGKLRASPDWWTLHRRGVRRRRVGGDPEEKRAMPKIYLMGSLPERIVYMELIKRGYSAGIDFDFQSSQAGGRIELGGMVVDFLFEYRRIALRVQGPTHETHIRQAKDREQESILVSMGFAVLDLPVDTIMNSMLLEEWFRQHLDPGSMGASITDNDYLVDVHY